MKLGIKKVLPSGSLTAGESIPGTQYKTCGFPPVRVISKGLTNKGEVLLECYDPNYQEWRNVIVAADYKLQTLKEGEAMPKTTVTKVAQAKNSVVAKGSGSGKGVYECWGQAFKKFGATPTAPTQIVAAMKAEFPGRKTNWAKWVNSVRTLYNRGDARLGVPKPTAPLKPYKTNGTAKPKGK